MISIVIPLYNKALYIKETIDNILNQTFQEFELIVVNDGSQDGGPEIVKSFKDSRIKLINKANGGVSSARNVGIKEAKYDYIAFLDADDEWLPNHLEEIHKLIVDYGNEANVFVTNFARKYPDGRVIVNRNDIRNGILKDYFTAVWKGAVIHTSCVCVSKTAMTMVGGFDERISRGEDLDLWIKLGLKYKIAYSNEVTELYTIDAINNSKNISNIKQSIVYYLNFNEVKSYAQFKCYVRMVFHKSLSLLLKEKSLLKTLQLNKAVLINFIKNKG